MTRQRVLVLAAVALVLLAATDFWRRIDVPRHSEHRDAGSFQPAVVRAPLSAAKISQDLVKWLPRLRPVAPGPGAGGAEEWSLALLAVFEDRGARFAVIQARPASSGAARLQRVVEGDELYGHKVARIESQHVTLSGGQGEQDLWLFKPAAAAVAGVGAAPAATAAPVSSAGAQVRTAPGATSRTPAAATASAGPLPRNRSSSQAGAAAPPAASAGARTVETKELKAGEAFELPASMRGMKVVEPVVPPQPAGGKNPAAEPKKPQNP